MANPTTVSAGPTSGQCDILAFFGKPLPQTKRQASIVITQLLDDPFNARRWLVERARRCAVAMPLRTESSTMATYNVARVLLHGFNLTVEEARSLLAEWNARCPMPRAEHELEHKLRSTDGQASRFGRGYLVNDLPSHPSAAARQAAGKSTEPQVRQKVEFDPAKLKEIAAPWRDAATLLFLANRSAHDPAAVTPEGFLKVLFGEEKILVFTDYYGQGDYVWPADAAKLGKLRTAKCGAWFLPQPVDGEKHPNPRGKKDEDGNAPLSRRSIESVRDFRYLLLESDKADVRDWLGFIVQVPLQIDALYSSGGRSIHALVRVDAPTYDEWQAEKIGLMPFLMGCVMVGGDRGVLSSVRLSRLPGVWREGKDDEDGKYVRFPSPKFQKLLYVRPQSEARPICELPVLRDVEKIWCERAKLLVDGYAPAPTEPGDDEVKAALGYYANVSKACAQALEDLA